MRLQNRLQNIILLGTVIGLTVSPAILVSAAMSSSNYTIQSDSLNFGGGNSSSANYVMESTAGEVATGDSSSANYIMRAGYQQMQSTYIALSVTGNSNLGNISGLIGGTATGSSTLTVTTDSPSGYSLVVQASTTPALQSLLGAKFTDYTPASTSSPDYTFTISPNISAFGFTTEGVDIPQRFKDNGSLCNGGTGDTIDTCWDGFSTTPKVIAESSARTSLSGTQTILKYRAQIGTNTIQDSGAYSAIVTITALSL